MCTIHKGIKIDKKNSKQKKYCPTTSSMQEGCELIQVFMVRGGKEPITKPVHHLYVNVMLLPLPCSQLETSTIMFKVMQSSYIILE
jgi:hypothetical protein